METLSANERNLIKMIHASKNPEETRKEIISYLGLLRKYPSQPISALPGSDRAAD